MSYKRIKPSSNLSKIIHEFWIYEDSNLVPQSQKVIPDGFSEIIVHYGDPYRINMNGTWQNQSRILFSNQISKFFFLENTGRSGIFGIKLYPYAFYQIFGIDQSRLTDKVLPLNELINFDLTLFDNLTQMKTFESNAIELIENWFSEKMNRQSYDINHVQVATTTIFEKHGMVDIPTLTESLKISTRQLERLFLKTTGVTLKFLSRIVKFNYIFQVIKQGNKPWIQIALASGYYDQSHFIKNFKEFTGEEPSSYGFDEQNLANFFLKK